MTNPVAVKLIVVNKAHANSVQEYFVVVVVVVVVVVMLQ